MPLEPSHDAGNIRGFVHSHRFPGANTAVPTANEDAPQLKLTEDFLKNGALTVDIFALSPAQAAPKFGVTSQSELSTTFAVGEEAESKVTANTNGEVAPVTAPLDEVQPALRRGETVRVDVVPDLSKQSEVSSDYDDRPFVFTAPLQGVSAKEERIPDVPIVTVAENEVTLPVVAHGAPAAEPKTLSRKEDWQRWNDYGIGLFLQGDLKGAAAAFEKVTEAGPNNPDGWVNIGRVAVQEGDMERARTVLEKALSLAPDLARANFFYAKVLRADGNYEAAAQRLRNVIAQYPRDRVALNDLGRILFLQRKYGEALRVLNSVLAVDPEDF